MLFVGLVVSCRRPANEPAIDEANDPVIAIINGREVHRSTSETFLRLKEVALEDDLIPAPEKEIFREFVIDQLLAEAAAKAGVEVSDDEIVEHFGSLPKKDDPELRQQLDDIRKLLTVQKFIRQKLVGAPKLEAAEMERYYRDHQGEFVADDRVHVLEILTTTEEEALELRKKLRPRDFRRFKQMARQHSKGLTADRSGDLGVFERGQLPEEFEKVVFGLKPGEISEVFRSEHGYHIFMVEEFIPSHTQAFHEVQHDIYEKMLAQIERVELEKYVEELLARSSVEILDPNLQFDWRQSDAKGEHQETSGQDS